MDQIDEKTANEIELTKFDPLQAIQYAADEPFKVVWRRLTFEVQRSNSFAERTLNKLQTLTGFGGRSIEEANNMSQPDDVQMPANSKHRIIFDDLNGCIKSGEISAILGPSGAGKTSLLNAICGRVDNYRGSVQLIGGGQRKMRLSIIPQKDYLMETLTVRENLLYSSKLLNSTCGFDHNANILRVVQMLNLLNCLDSRAAKISGGEYKRVSIAQELLRQPDILILDEPTSGLDSMNCKNLIRSLVQLIEASRRGAIKQIAIVLTIHQPDVEVFHMFDRVYCMSKRGRVIYDGLPGEVMKVLSDESMGSLDLEQSIPNLAHVNPANLLIEVASDVYGEQVVNRLAEFQRQQFELGVNSGVQADSPGGQCKRNKLSSSADIQQQSKSKSLTLFANQSKSSLSTLSSSSADGSHLSETKRPNQLTRDKRLTAKSKNQGQFWYHTKLLAQRAFISTTRDPLLAFVALIFHLSIPFVMWTVYVPEIGTVMSCPIIQRDLEMLSLVSNETLGMMKQLQDDLTIAVECIKMFFFAIYSFSLCTTSLAALTFPLSMQVLLKEVRNGWYSLPSFVLAKTLASFPFEVLFPVISVAMIYVLLGMQSSYMEWRLLGMALTVGLNSMIMNTQGLIFGALCMDSVQAAVFLASSATLPQVLLGGFTTRIKMLPLLLQKLSFLSPFLHSNLIMSMIRFGFGTCACDSSTGELAQEPYFSDMPSNIKPLFTYYLTSLANNQVIEPTAIAANETMSLTNSNAVTNATQISQSLVSGISCRIGINSSTRADMISRIESNEVDVFGRLANLMGRSFSYGRSYDSCDSVRSQILINADAPPDEYLPLLFAGLIGLLVALKLILFTIVKYKIRSQT